MQGSVCQASKTSARCLHAAGTRFGSLNLVQSSTLVFRLEYWILVCSRVFSEDRKHIPRAGISVFKLVTQTSAHSRLDLPETWCPSHQVWDPDRFVLMTNLIRILRELFANSTKAFRVVLWTPPQPGDYPYKHECLLRHNRFDCDQVWA